MLEHLLLVSLLTGPKCFFFLILFLIFFAGKTKALLINRKITKRKYPDYKVAYVVLVGRYFIRNAQIQILFVVNEIFCDTNLQQFRKSVSKGEALGSFTWVRCFSLTMPLSIRRSCKRS